MDGTRDEGLLQLQGREAVAALAASGQSIKAFCESSGQSEWSMRRWRVEFGEALGVPIRRRPGTSNARVRAKPGVKRAAPRASTLVPIMMAQAKAQPADMSVQIRLRGERTMIVSAAVDAQLLSRLITTVERAS